MLKKNLEMVIFFFSCFRLFEKISFRVRFGLMFVLKVKVKVGVRSGLELAVRRLSGGEKGFTIAQAVQYRLVNP